MEIPENAPFSPDQRAGLNQWLATVDHNQCLWLSGFLAGVQSAGPAMTALAEPALETAPAEIPLTILFGSESGNSEALAAEAKSRASKQGYAPTVVDMADMQPEELAKQENLLVVVSTWGEGDPPDRAVPFHEAIMGEKAPRLEKTRFSVLALGDTSYEQFCQTGKDFDRRFEELGAHRFHPRVDCDVDYEEPFQKWINGALHDLQEIARPKAPAGSNGAAALTAPVAPVSPAIEYGKKNPFPSELKTRLLLNGRGSKKETYHYELSLAGSGLSYEPGDSLAVIPTNDPGVVNAIIEAGKFNRDDAVPAPDGTEGPLDEVLFHYFDVTGLTKNLIKKYNELMPNPALEALLDSENKIKLQEYLWGREIVDLLSEHPIDGLTAKAFVKLLRKMPPRLYSIASSPKAHPDEVHLTIATVRYHAHGRDRMGVCSTYLADRVPTGNTLPVYTHANKNFKMPKDPDTPMIMVGPGTGIAPFRAFIEDRAATGAKGKNWLFFGDQHFLTDFLYQTEWQGYQKDGTLHRLDVAFSRDQKQKVYVQHRIEERAKDLYAWMQEGAHFYVCGDASRMAHDVHEALINVYQTQGGLSREDAEATVKQLQKDRRYQRDVY